MQARFVAEDDYMANSLKMKISLNSIWGALLILYIAAGYFSQGSVLVPVSVNTMALYLFLAFSVFAIICSRKVKVTPIFWWEIVCLGLAFVAMLYAPSFSILGGTYYQLLVNFVIVFIFTQMTWNKASFGKIMRTFVVASTGLIIVLALTGNLGDTSDTGRLGQDLSGNANILGAMLMVGTIYAIWLFISTENKKEKWFLFFSLIIIYFGMFLCGGRKYIVLPLIFAYILLAHKADRKGRTHLVRNTLIIVVLVFLLYQLIMNVPFFYDAIGHRFEGFFGLFSETQKADGSSMIRKRMIEAAMKKWPESPFWGHGFDSFKYYNVSVTGHDYYSHNNFLELLYNQGLIGFVAYYSFYVYLFCKAIKLPKRSLSRGFVMAVLATILAFEIVEVTYSISPVQFMLFFAYYQVNNRQNDFDDGAGENNSLLYKVN